MRANEFGQPIGADLDGWISPEFPSAETHAGRTVSLEPLDAARHAQDLMDVFASAEESLWTYIAFGPFADVGEVSEVIDSLKARPGFQPFAVVRDGRAVGMLSYLRIEPKPGVLEIGSIVFGPGLSRTTAATETIFLLIDHCFNLGYRRCEWKCDALNAPSRAAAERFGFVYEGTFAKATHYKGRSRDTAWFAITDDRWPQLRTGFVSWLAPENFDADGTQLRSLTTD